MTPIRLTAVLTHPVQYFAPWFRHIAAGRPELDLTVLYATEPTAEQQGVGFDRAFRWDVPLREGYRSRVVRPAAAGDDLRADRPLGLDVPAIAGALRETRPEVVLLPGWHSATYLRALATCALDRVPVLYRGDSNLLTAPAGLRRAAWAARTAGLLHLFSAHLAVGRHARDYLARFGVAPWRIFDSPHCVDNAAFAASAAPHQTAEGRAAARRSFGIEGGAHVVLFAGKLEPKKRLLDLCAALARLGEGHHLLVVGSGPDEAAARAAAARLGVRATFAGFQNQLAIGRAYAAADCLALPSSQLETWGLVVNEAFATGLPAVVSSAVGCAPDLCAAGETGETFPLGDVAALAAAIERLRARRAAGHDFAAACRARIARHDFAAATAGLLSACRAVVRRPVPRSAAPDRVVACFGGMVSFTGLERMSFEVLRSLRDRGADVHCIVNTWASDRIVAEAERMGASWSTGFYWYRLDRHARDPGAWARMALDVLRTSGGLLRDSARLRATHVFAPEMMAIVRNLPALLLLRALGVRVILKVGNAPTDDPLYRLLWRRAVDPAVDRIVCNSRASCDLLRQIGVSDAKIGLVLNTAASRAGVPTNGVPRDPRRVIFIGQLIPDKGVDLLLDAVALLSARGREVRLSVVGDLNAWEPPQFVGYRASLLERAARPDLADRVTFLGWREDVPALLAGAAVHCAPSRPAMREGMAGAVVEAKRSGVPSVVCPSGGLAEAIRHRVDGWVCERADPEEIARGLEFLLDEPGALDAAARAARASYEDYRPERFARDWWIEFTRGDA
jgi:glycosyltransferase involved in cell wall biosynthesis